MPGCRALALAKGRSSPDNFGPLSCADSDSKGAAAGRSGNPISNRPERNAHVPQPPIAPPIDGVRNIRPCAFAAAAARPPVETAIGLTRRSREPRCRSAHAPISFLFLDRRLSRGRTPRRAEGRTIFTLGIGAAGRVRVHMTGSSGNSALDSPPRLLRNPARYTPPRPESQSGLRSGSRQRHLAPAFGIGTIGLCRTAGPGSGWRGSAVAYLEPSRPPAFRPPRALARPRQFLARPAAPPMVARDLAILIPFGIVVASISTPDQYCARAARDHVESCRRAGPTKRSGPSRRSISGAARSLGAPPP